MGLYRANVTDETNNANGHNMAKNPIWQEADQLAERVATVFTTIK